MELLTPVTLKATFLVLWEENKEWDHLVKKTQLVQWKEILNNFETLHTINLPIYSDASRNAYITAVYLLIEIEEKLSIKLMFSKSRIAPKNLISIPQLELLGVLIGVRSFKRVLENLKLSVIKKILWTDLQCVLSWIKETEIGINWRK